MLWLAVLCALWTGANSMTSMDVCNPQTKTCGLYPLNPAPFNQVSYFLGMNTRSPMGDDYTLLISPVKNQCSGASCYTLYEADEIPDEEVNTWRIVSSLITFKNLTIRSAYKTVQVKFESDQYTATASVSSGSFTHPSGDEIYIQGSQNAYSILCNTFIAIDTGLTVIDVHFTVDDGCLTFYDYNPQYGGMTVVDKSALVFYPYKKDTISFHLDNVDTTNSMVTVFPDVGYSQSVNITGTKIENMNDGIVNLILVTGHSVTIDIAQDAANLINIYGPTLTNFTVTSLHPSNIHNYSELVPPSVMNRGEVTTRVISHTETNTPIYILFIVLLSLVLLVLIVFTVCAIILLIREKKEGETEEEANHRVHKFAVELIGTHDMLTSELKKKFASYDTKTD